MTQAFVLPSSHSETILLGPNLGHMNFENFNCPKSAEQGQLGPRVGEGEISVLLGVYCDIDQLEASPRSSRDRKVCPGKGHVEPT